MRWMSSPVAAGATILLVAACAARSEQILDRGRPGNQPVCNESAGRPLPATVVDTIGPRGGKLQLGPHSLDIPRNALNDDTGIVFVEYAGDRILVSIESVDGDTIRFARPAELTLNLAPRCPGSVNRRDYSIYRDTTANAERLKTRYPLFSRKLRTDLDHNSFYIVAD